MIKLKELLTEPIPEKLFHGTFDPLAQQAEVEGLIPGGRHFKNFEDIEWGVYLTDDWSMAGSMVESTENPNVPEDWFGQIVIMVIDTTKLDKSKFDKDPHLSMSDDWKYHSYIYRGKIPPEAIKEVLDFT